MHVEYAAEKAASVRRLRRTSTGIIDRGAQKGPRELFRIVAGVLTLESGWSPALGEALNDALAASAEDGRLDLGCALRDGAFEAGYRDGGAVELATSEPAGALMFFLLRLFARLQALGTVSAIDLAEYGRSLEAHHE